MRIAPLGLLATICLLTTIAHAEVDWLQRQCRPAIDALRAIPDNEGIGNDAAKAIAREELEWVIFVRGMRWNWRFS